jgi:hypothetical protein
VVEGATGGRGVGAGQVFGDEFIDVVGFIGILDSAEDDQMG